MKPLDLFNWAIYTSFASDEALEVRDYLKYNPVLMAVRPALKRKEREKGQLLAVVNRRVQASLN